MRSSLLRGVTTAILLTGAGLLAVRFAPAHADSPPRVVPPPALDLPASGATQVATLSGGCFWGVQGVFEHVQGVTKAVSGYAGGLGISADYETVSTGTTGHAETVQITFDPSKISYGQILQIFFSVALDPTEVGRQGPDSGSQYRSEIWVTSDDQARVASAYIAQLDAAHVWDQKIATRVDKLPHFYAAEEYHQDFLVRHPTQSYIAYVDMPKVQALHTLFPAAWREVPATVNPVTPGS